MTGPVRIPSIGQALANAHSSLTDSDLKTRAFELVEGLADEFGEPFETMLSELN